MEIAFPWIFYCFIGYLDIDQIFSIFDRMIGSKKLEIISIISAAIIINKEKYIYKCQKYQEIINIFEDILDEDVNENLKLFYETRNFS